MNWKILLRKDLVDGEAEKRMEDAAEPIGVRITAVDAEEPGTMRETDAEIPKDGDGRAPGKWENGEKSRQDAETRNGIYAG